MRGQAERLLERPDASLLHDELAEINEAVYFHEFAAHAARTSCSTSPRPTSSGCGRRGPRPAADALPRSRMCAASSTWTS